MKANIRYLWTILLVAAIALAACGVQPADALPDTGAGIGAATEAPATVAVIPATATQPAAPIAAPTEPATNEPTSDDMAGRIGGTVTVMGIWGGAEADQFLAMLRPFEEQTGIEVEYEHPRNLTGAIETRIQAGDPPDVAGLPNPGALRQFAEQGLLVPLDEALDTARLQAEYPAGFTDLAQVDGQTYGVFIKASVKNLVWYRPDVFQERGYTVPQTWEELQSLEQQIISGGGAPWCVGVSTGWPGTDWIEDLLLQTAGPETYNAFWQGAIPWTDPAVAAAWEAFGRIVHDPALAHGGADFVLSSNSGGSSSLMFDEEPGCFLHHQASFFPTFIAENFPEVVLGQDLDFFPFPAIDEGHGTSLLVSGDLLGMFNDTPQARALMAYLTAADTQAIWAENGGYIAPNRAVSPEVYPDELTQAIARLYVEADSVHFDASDLMASPVQEAFHQAVLQFVQDPAALPSILEDMEAVAQEVGGE